MLKSTFKNIKIEGMCSAIPINKEVISEKYNEVFGKETIEHISKSTGVIEKRTALKEQTASDFAYVAAKKLIEEKNIDVNEIGVVVFVTQTPDYIMPASSYILHKRLGLSSSCMVYDINMGCAGYIHGMEVVCSLMRAANIRYGLLLTGDTTSKLASPYDRSLVMLVGDGGSATLLKTAECSEKINIVCETYSDKYEKIIVPAGGFRNRNAKNERYLWSDGNERSDYEMYMNGMDVFSFTISEVTSLIGKFLEEAQGKEVYDSYILHQANAMIIKQIIRKCALSKDKVPISIDRYGNTSMTSVPITICDKYGQEKNDKRLKLFACGFGVGLTCSAADFYINSEDIYPIIETDESYREGIHID